MLIHLDDIFENIKQLKKEDQIKLFTNSKFLQLRNINYYEFYDIFAYLIQNNHQEFEKVLFTNLNLIKIFLEAEPVTYYELSFSYNFLKQLTIKVVENNLDIKHLKILITNNLKDELVQFNFLHEKLPSKFKIQLLKIFNNQVVTQYLQEEKFNLNNHEIAHLILREVVVPKYYYENKDFFLDQVMSSNLTEMNNTLLSFSRTVDTSYLENLKYKIFDNIILSYKDDKFNILPDSLEYIFIQQYKFDHEDSSNLSKKLITNLVIANLFQDNLRNVCINIQEILAGNENNNLINLDHLTFYKKILNIYSLNIEDIVDIYQENKNKNIMEMFYDDIRLLKNHIYTNILNSCLKIENISNLENIKLSNKYQTKIYELKGEPFTCLVSCLTSPQEDITYFKRNCYSLISDKNMHVYMQDSLIFGYTNIDIQHIMHMYEQDSYSNAMIGGTNYVNRIRNRDFILSSNLTNEIQITNDFYQDNLYKRVKPSYLICFDEIDEFSLHTSKDMQLPIILIHKEKYKLDETDKIYSSKTIDNMYYSENTKEFAEDSYKSNHL